MLPEVQPLSEPMDTVPPSIDAASDEWFAAPPASSRRPSVRPSAPPPPAEIALGEFLGDPFADGWFKG